MTDKLLDRIKKIVAEELDGVVTVRVEIERRLPYQSTTQVWMHEFQTGTPGEYETIRGID